MTHVQIRASSPACSDPTGGPAPDTISGKRILVADDHAVVRLGLRALLAEQDWVERCVQAQDASEAIHLSARYEPHVALVDLFLGAESGLDLCRELKRQHAGNSILLMSGDGRVPPAVARQAGAVGFVSKSWPIEKLLAGIYRAACGKLVFESGSEPARTANLTAREIEVLQQLARGASNPEAAETLHMSRETVKHHASSVYAKLGARNRADAVGRAQRMGLVQ
jgi:DNA-binding NarL/FixJ family response regulator